MKAILLLAGQSRRFWPLSEKPLFSVCGKAIAKHQLDRLVAAGIADIILVASKENKNAVSDLLPNLTLVEQEDADGGMHAALTSALPHCGEESVLIVGGNDLFDPAALKTLVQESEKDGVGGAILAQKVSSYFPGGYLQTEGSKIVGIQEKPGEGNEPSDLVNIVAHAHNDVGALRAAIDDTGGDAEDAYERVLDHLFQSHTYNAVPYEGVWQAVKYPWHLLHALPILLDEIEGQQIHESVEIHDTAVVEGNVIIEEGVKILPHATVCGPCYIGKGSVVANNALIRNSSIGAHCVVGYSTEVKGSLWQDHVWTHMSYIGDTVVGRNVSFGAGCVTGNFRLDEGEVESVVGKESINTELVKCGSFIGEGCRIGVKTVTNPGCKIGAGTFVVGCTFITEDVPEKMFVRTKDGVVKVSENRSEAPDPEDRDTFMKNLK